MADTAVNILVLLALFQVKHMLADYFLQTQRMLSGRGEYFHIGRAQHAGVHAVGSVLVFAAVGAPPLFILTIVVIEWLVHFNIDWAKARFSETHNLTPAQAGFWRAAGVDQAAHQLTYVAMIWAWIEFAIV